MENNFCIVDVKDEKRKSTYTKEILESLLDWFANEQARDDYVKEVSKYPYWVALNKDNQCIGFFSVKVHYKHTGDVFICGILPEYQHNGIGKALYNAAELYFRQIGCKYVIVKTLSDIVNFEPYEQTRRFYKSVGFESLITLTEMWDEENPCLIMIKMLN